MENRLSISVPEFLNMPLGGQLAYMNTCLGEGVKPVIFCKHYGISFKEYEQYFAETGRIFSPKVMKFVPVSELPQPDQPKLVLKLDQGKDSGSGDPSLEVVSPKAADDKVLDDLALEKNPVENRSRETIPAGFDDLKILLGQMVELSQNHLQVSERIEERLSDGKKSVMLGVDGDFKIYRSRGAIASRQFKIREELLQRIDELFREEKFQGYKRQDLYSTLIFLGLKALS
jgi:hypothetical protein